MRAPRPATISDMDLADALRTLLEPLTPTRCAACGLPGEGICADCADALVHVRPPLCARCGHPWPEPAARCRGCLAGCPPARAAIGYDARAAAVLRAMKDRGRRRLGDDLAAVLVARAAPPAGHVLVPVPAARARRVERGFDQAEEIARGAGARWGLPVAVVLERVGGGDRQRGAPRARRLAIPSDAFRARGRAPRRCCLLDDVHTTGSTLRAAARALRAAGAVEVVARTVARAAVPGAEWWTAPARGREPRRPPSSPRQVPDARAAAR